MGCFVSNKVEAPGSDSPSVVVMDGSDFNYVGGTVSLTNESLLLLNLVYNHQNDNPADLERIQKLYTSMSSYEDGRSTIIWDLETMTTDFSKGGYDGLIENWQDRDEINIVILKALVASGTGVNTITTHGRTALQVAALAGDFNYCKELVAMGADVNALNDAGETALDLAKQWNNRPKDLVLIITYLESLV